MTASGWLQIVVLLLVLTAVTPLLGAYIHRVFSGERLLLVRALGPAERALTRLLRRLAAVFGRALLVEHDQHTAQAVTRVAERRGTTHIVMGVPHLRHRFGLARPSLVDELVARAPTLHLALVGDLQASGYLQASG